MRESRHLVTLWNPSYASDAMGEHSHLHSPVPRPPNHPAVGKPGGVGELMLRVPGRPDPEGEIGDLLELCIEPRMRKGHADLHAREEALRRPHGRSEVGVPGDDDQGVAGLKVKQPRYVEPVEVGRSQCGFGMPNREVQIKPVHQEGHPIGHRMFPQKENPTGRNPWGQGKLVRQPGGVEKKVPGTSPGCQGDPHPGVPIPSLLPSCTPSPPSLPPGNAAVLVFPKGIWWETRGAPMALWASS